MAFPSLLLPLLFTGGSMAVNTIGANRAADAIAGVNFRERQRQDRLDDQAFAINDRATERFDDIEGQKADRTTDLTEFFKTAAATPAPTEAGLPKSDSNLVVSADAKAQDTARTKSNQRAENLADFRSLGSLLSDFAISGQRDAGELNTLRGFKRGFASILPTELAAAQQKGSGFRTLGDLLSLGAAITMPSALIANPGNAVPWLRNAATTAKGAVAAPSTYAKSVLPALY